MKMKSLTQWLLIIAATAILTSCEKTEDIPNIAANNLKGMFVVCEGGFYSSTGDITYYHPDSLTSISNLYEKANGTKLGSILSAFSVIDTMGFLVVNNSQKVTVVNMKNFKKIKSIEGFSYPRNIVKANENTVYISNGNGYSNNYIYAISLITLSKTDSVEVGKGPEKMVKTGNNVYVANSGGFTNNDSTLSVIDTETFSVTKTIKINKLPTDLVVDANNNVWAYCKGVPDYSNYPAITYSGSALCKVTTDGQITSFPLGAITTQGINCLAISTNGKILYYVTDATYEMSITNTQLPTNKFYDKAFFGIDVDPASGQIIGLDEVNNKALILSTSGIEEDNFDTGSFPDAVIFSW